MPPMPCQVGLLRDLKTMRFRLLSDTKTVDTRNSEQAFSGRPETGSRSALSDCCQPRYKDSPST